MVRVSRRYPPTTIAAVQALGAMVAEGRRERGWTAAALAARLGTSEPTLRRIERGAPGVAIGLFFEAALLCGVELFAAPPAELERIAREAKLRAAVLPARVRSRPVVIDDNF